MPYSLSEEHVDVLWECLATDPRSSDELYIWMCGQVRLREQHALSPDSLRHVFIKKLPSLPPETVTMHALSLFQQLCSIARSSEGQDIEAAASSMDYLWKIALCATRTGKRKVLFLCLAWITRSAVSFVYQKAYFQM